MEDAICGICPSDAVWSSTDTGNAWNGAIL